ncbi:uncharacterized protein LOC127750344 [Frankliniella occidentalis]|uniref:Uncharacterized protein LOC127750344 n=1 Tax=Frankliniella occidentalis TaxID=133901 RepID=A0A9C6X265_FRAOC|nr:uncharacterized protein LOC127750344 [Frankliniella occidentalis]
MLNPHWVVASPSLIQFVGTFQNFLLDDNRFYFCGCCLEKCYIVLEQYSPGGLPALAEIPQLPPPGVIYPEPVGPAPLAFLNQLDLAEIAQDVEDGAIDLIDLVSEDEQD